MHRSGTSAVTGALHLMGAYFGPEGAGLEPNEENPMGYWERRDFHALCNRLMRAADAQWSKVAEFTLDKIPADVRESELQTFADVLGDLDAHRPWALKEPLLCLLLPLFLPQLVTPVAVHVNRDPLEVALSLQRRSGFPLQFGVALWEAYVRAALSASESIPRVLIQYADLVADPKRTLGQLHDSLADLGVEGLSVPTDEQLAEFVRSDLHRQRSEPQRRAEYLTPLQLELAEALDAGLAQAAALPREMSHGPHDLLARYEHAYALGREAAEHEARPRIQKHKQSLKEADEARMAIAGEARALSERVATLTDLAETAEKDLHEQRESARKRETEMAEMRRLADVAASQIRDAAVQTKRQAAEIDRYRLQGEVLKAELQEAHLVRRRLRRKLARTRRDNERLRAEVEQATERRRRVQKRYRTLKRRYARLVRFPLIRVALGVRRRVRNR